MQDSICVKGINLTNSKEITLQIMRLQRFLSRKQHKSLCLISPDTITLSELIFFFFFEEQWRERLNWSWSNTRDNKTVCLLNLRFTWDWWLQHFRALKNYVQMQMTQYKDGNITQKFTAQDDNPAVIYCSQPTYQEIPSTLNFKKLAYT